MIFNNDTNKSTTQAAQHARPHKRPLSSIKAMSKTEKLRLALIVLAAPLGFLLVEMGTNPQPLQIAPVFVLLNIALLACIFFIIFLVAQRTRGSIAFFFAICLIAGIANHYVIEFKGEPIVPADLLALSTAAAVTEGYSFSLDIHVIAAVVLFVLYCVLLAIAPKKKITKKSCAINLGCAMVLAAAFGIFTTAIDIEDVTPCKVDPWRVEDSYKEQGSALCFFARVQDVSPKKPADYDPETVDTLLSDAASKASFDKSTIATDAQDVSVMVVMNETFSDLSRFPGLENSEARPDNFYEIASQSIESGYTCVSALGGGTCNSEFEFLTGSSMGHMGAGVYPYVLYDLNETENLASYFSTLGYTTHAIHPESSNNWRRGTIYGQLGFEEFSSITSFEDADRLRGLVTDRSTYDHALSLLQQNEGPQFIFDVTIQNHGGYKTGQIPDSLMCNIELPDGSTSDELNEYASSLKQSDKDLTYLVEELNKLDRPVVLCFFGDHQPSFSSWLFEQTHNGKTADEIGIEAVQERYTVPYFIWANDAAKKAGVTDKNALPSTGANGIKQQTSLNYLGARLVKTAGLPTTAYQEFLLATSEEVLSMNMNGYLTADGTWYRMHEKSDASQVLNNYAQVQYGNLFDRKNKSDLFVAASQNSTAIGTHDKSSRDLQISA